MKKRSMLAAVMLLAAGMIASAQTSNNSAYVRVVHASPDAPAVDVYLDGKQTVDGAAFKAVTPFGNVPAGAHKVVVTAAGNRDAVVFEANVNLSAGTYYTVAAVGYLKNIKPKIFSSTSMNMGGSQAEVTVYHLSPNGPRVDAVAPTMNNTKVIDGVAYGNKQTVRVSPMAANLNIVPAGMMTPVVDNLSDVTLEAGKSYSVFALGLVGASGKSAFDLVAVADEVKMGSMDGR